MKWNEYIVSRMQSPFVWGSNDCCLFASDGYKEVYGIDIAQDFRGYSTEAGAYSAVNVVTDCNNLKDMMGVLAEAYGLREVREYEDGDVVLIRMPYHKLQYFTEPHSLGLVLLPYCYTVGPKGLIRFPLINIIKGWRKCL